MELFRNDDGQGGIRPGGTQCRRGARGRSPRSPTLDWISTAPWSSSGTTTDREGFEPSVPLAGYTRFPGVPLKPLEHLSHSRAPPVLGGGGSIAPRPRWFKTLSLR